MNANQQKSECEIGFDKVVSMYPNIRIKKSWLLQSNEKERANAIDELLDEVSRLAILSNQG